MPDYSFISEPSVPQQNVLGMLIAATKLQELQGKQQQQQGLMEAGKLAAGGDYDAAQKLALERGQFDTVNQLAGIGAAQRTRQNALDVGQMAAQGNYAGAQNLALQRGDLDTYARMRNIAKDMDAERLRDAAELQAKLGNLARLADTPEKWKTAIAAARKHGLNVEGLDDFVTGRPLALAQAKMSGDALDDERRRREQEIAELKSGLVRRGTITAPGLPPDAGTFKINPATGQPDPATFAPNVPAVQVGESAAPADMGSGRVSSSAQEREIQALREEYRAKFGKELPTAVANAALRSGALITQDANGNPVLSSDPHSMQGIRERGAELREKNLDAANRYQLSLASGIGKQDAANLGRVQQVHAVNGHLDMIENSVGGTELDVNKLTPEQRDRRDIAEGAVGYLKSKVGYGILVGELSPQSDTPDFLRNLKQTQTILEGELTRLATMGMGAVAQGIREHMNQAVGDLASAPSVKNLLSATRTIREMSNVIANMPMIGRPQEGLVNPELRQPGMGAPATPKVGEVRKGYRFKGGDPSKRENWEAAQ